MCQLVRTRRHCLHVVTRNGGLGCAVCFCSDMLNVLHRSVSSPVFLFRAVTTLLSFRYDGALTHVLPSFGSFSIALKPTIFFSAFCASPPRCRPPFWSSSSSVVSRVQGMLLTTPLRIFRLTIINPHSSSHSTHGHSFYPHVASHGQLRLVSKPSVTIRIRLTVIVDPDGSSNVEGVEGDDATRPGLKTKRNASPSRKVRRESKMSEKRPSEYGCL
ncbi:hypothetical protein EDB85DRAFT_6459 [Lactarius pseudohatsudake]|nr:hypothetical protein EDB85DRAFT_6459 [Lactarius pseudohatsudake]